MRVVHHRVALGFVLLLRALLARNVDAWGDAGHQMICEIAFQELTPSARAAVQRLLQHDADFSTFSKACTWPDHPRKRAGEHFVNLPRSATRLEANPCPVDAPCAVTALEADLAALTRVGATDTERRAALKFLGHWVGDVHQPLHVSFKDDKGGNEIDEEGPCTQNLHAVWETCLIKRTLGTNLQRIAADLRRPVTEAQRTQWTSTSAKDWANESFAITTSEEVDYYVKTATGCFYEEDNEILDPDEDHKVVTVDEAYIARHLPMIKQRLTQAGVRLGALLNRALGGP